MGRHMCGLVRRCSAVERARSGSLRPGVIHLVRGGEGALMAGAMRKMGIYLGLVEDDERRSEVGDYDEYDDYDQEPEVMPVRRDRPVRPWEDAPVVHDPGYAQ